MNLHSNASNSVRKMHHILNLDHVDEAVKIEYIRTALLEFDASNYPRASSKLISELVDAYEQLAETPNQTTSISTGIDAYDRAFGGLWPGEFVVIGGRPAMGKTHLLVNMASNISVEQNVLYYTLDLSSSMLTARVVASLTQVPTNRFLHGTLSETDKKLVELAKMDLSRMKLHILDQQVQSMTAFKELCRKHLEEHNVKVIFVDYLQLLGSNRYKNNRELEISYISRELKGIARDLNVCLVASSQLSRSVEQRGGDKRPVLSDLRESGAIEQDADKVIFVYRPEYYGFLQDEDGNSTARQMDLIMCKNRSGMLDVAHLKVDELFTKFEPYQDPNRNFRIDPDRLTDFDDTPPF